MKHKSDFINLSSLASEAAFVAIDIASCMGKKQIQSLKREYFSTLLKLPSEKKRGKKQKRKTSQHFLLSSSLPFSGLEQLHRQSPLVDHLGHCWN